MNQILQLSEKNIWHYLVDKGYMDMEQVVNGRMIIRRSFSRNNNFIVQTEKTNLLVKQLRKVDDEKTESLFKEATCYWLINNDPVFGPLKKITAAYYGFDYPNYALTTSWLENTENIYDYHTRSNTFPVELAKSIARIFSVLHAVQASNLTGQSSGKFFQKSIPWPFRIVDSNFKHYVPKNNADREIINLVQNDIEYKTLVQQLIPQWENKCLIHGDIKWANFLLQTKNAGNDKFDLKLVDWEFADIGDPCWDIAGLFQSYLAFCVLNRTKEEFGRNLNKVQPALSAFWQTYKEGSKMNSENAQELLIKIVQFTGVRIIQTCLESTWLIQELPENTVQFLQLGLNILKQPTLACESIFGIKKQPYE